MLNADGHVGITSEIPLNYPGAPYGRLIIMSAEAETAWRADQSVRLRYQFFQHLRSAMIVPRKGDQVL